MSSLPPSLHATNAAQETSNATAKNIRFIIVRIKNWVLLGHNKDRDQQPK